MLTNILVFVMLGIALSAAFALSGCQLWPSGGGFSITEIKTAPALGEDFMPLKATDTFPARTPKIYCWFRWRNSGVNTQVVAKWRYLSQNINIINHTFTLPRKEGYGSVVLTMPEGKSLPSGSYRVDLVMDKHILKSHKFKIE